MNTDDGHKASAHTNEKYCAIQTKQTNVVAEKGKNNEMKKLRIKETIIILDKTVLHVIPLP